MSKKKNKKKNKKKKIKKCSCPHAGNCPMNDFHSPFVRTYPDGTKIYRPLTGKEKEVALVGSVDENGVSTLYRKVEYGDIVGVTNQGELFIAAKPIDVKRATDYMLSTLNQKCRCFSATWRRKHPVPEKDLELSPEQMVSEKNIH